MFINFSASYLNDFKICIAFLYQFRQQQHIPTTGLFIFGKESMKQLTIITHYTIGASEAVTWITFIWNVQTQKINRKGEQITKS